MELSKYSFDSNKWFNNWKYSVCSMNNMLSKPLSIFYSHWLKKWVYSKFVNLFRSRYLFLKILNILHDEINKLISYLFNNLYLSLPIYITNIYLTMFKMYFNFNIILRLQKNQSLWQYLLIYKPCCIISFYTDKY